jgi:CRP/FNR family cyclic AMP-dependent transcriptional regulator
VKDRKASEIREMALFGGCSAEDVRWIAGVADTLDVPAGRRLVRRGQSVREFVVLVSGAAAASNGESSVSFAPGAYFGEVGLIDGQPYTHTIETRTQVRLLVFSPQAFRGLLRRSPAVSQKLLAGLVAQARSADQDPRSFRAVS